MPALQPRHTHASALALAAALLWGLIEFTALLRARWSRLLRRRG